MMSEEINMNWTLQQVKSYLKKARPHTYSERTTDEGLIVINLGSCISGFKWDVFKFTLAGQTKKTQEAIEYLSKN